MLKWHDHICCGLNFGFPLELFKPVWLLFSFVPDFGTVVIILRQIMENKINKTSLRIIF